MRRFRSSIAQIGFVFWVITCPLHAAVFCPFTSSEFASALAISASNGENDEIRLGSLLGDYEVPDETGFHIRAERGRTLRISGRWAGFAFPCQAQYLAHRTGISANSKHRGRVLTLDYSEGFDEDVLISDLTLYNGYSATIEGACLDAVISGGHGDLVLDRVEISGCENDAEEGPAVRVLNRGISGVLIRNSIVTQNSTEGPAIVLGAVSEGAILRVFNNTIAGNGFYRNGAVPAVKVLSMNGGQVSLFNTVVAENREGRVPELILEGAGVEMHHNVFDSSWNGRPASESGNQIIENALLFESSPFDLRPRASSALIDAGADFDFFWAGTLDINRSSRLQNQRLDVGAYESDFLHVNGFE